MNTAYCLVAALLLTAPVAASAAEPQRPAHAGAPSGTQPADTDYSGKLVTDLKERFAERFAGAYLDPGRLTVRLTGEGQVPRERHSIDGSLIDVVFENGASHTLEDLRQTLEKGEPVIAEAVPGSFGRYIDERTGEIVIGVPPNLDVSKLAAGLSDSLGAPVRLEAQETAILNR